MKVKFIDRDNQVWCVHDESNNHLAGLKYLGGKKWVLARGTGDGDGSDRTDTFDADHFEQAELHVRKIFEDAPEIKDEPDSSPMVKLPQKELQSFFRPASIPCAHSAK